MAQWRTKAVERNAKFAEEHGGYVPEGLRQHEHMEENPLVVDYVSVAPIGPRGRYSASFTATNVDFEGDRRTQSSAFMFDETAYKLDEPFPAKLDHYIEGRKDGKYEIVGKYEDLYEEADGLMEDLLKHKGYEDPAEISFMILNSHTGHLKEKK